MSDDQRGYMTHETTVWCRCLNWETFNDNTGLSPSRQARQRGWKYTRTKGWVCLVCQRKQEQYEWQAQHR